MRDMGQPIHESELARMADGAVRPQVTTVELIRPVLGLSPYILVESEPDDTAPQGFSLRVRAGGGISSRNEIVAMLILVIESTTGVSLDDYTRAVDVLTALVDAGLLITPQHQAVLDRAFDVRSALPGSGTQPGLLDDAVHLLARAVDALGGER